MWEETFEGKLQELSRNLSGETRKNNEKLQDNRRACTYLNWAPSEYEKINLSLEERAKGFVTKYILLFINLQLIICFKGSIL
jgi:hypothetical protein